MLLRITDDPLQYLRREPVPYPKNERTGIFSVRNPLLDDPEAIISTRQLPSGVSQVPFRCRWSGRAEE